MRMLQLIDKQNTDIINVIVIHADEVTSLFKDDMYIFKFGVTIPKEEEIMVMRADSDEDVIAKLERLGFQVTTMDKPFDLNLGG